MATKKFLTAEDLFEEETGEKVVKSKPKQKPISKREPSVPAPRGKESIEQEKYEDDKDSLGSDEDYKWSLEDGGSDTSKALEAFLGKGDVRKESELTEKHIVSAALLLEMASRWKHKRIRAIVHHFLSCRVSLNRGSRGEAVQAFTGLVENRRANATENIANSLRRD